MQTWLQLNVLFFNAASFLPHFFMPAFHNFRRWMCFAALDLFFFFFYFFFFFDFFFLNFFIFFILF